MTPYWELPLVRRLVLKRKEATITLFDRPEEQGGGQFAEAIYEPDFEPPFNDPIIEEFHVRERCESLGGHLYAGWWSGSGTQVYPSWGQGVNFVDPPRGFFSKLLDKR